MKSANEIRQLMSSLEASPAEVEAIEGKIKSAAKEGKTFIWHYKDLSNPMKNLLALNGYEVVSDYDQREQTPMIKISWANPPQQKGGNEK